MTKNGKEYQAARIDMKTAPVLRELFNGFEEDTEAAAGLLEGYSKGAADKPRKPKKRKLKEEIYSKYFSEEESDDYVNDIIDEALRLYFEQEKE